MMKSKIFFVVFVVLVTGVGSRGNAYDVLGAIHWPSESCTTNCAKTNYPIYELCTAGVTPVNTFDEFDTADWSLWMWERQGTSTVRFYHNTSGCAGNYDNGSDWWGWGQDAESNSQFHFYPYDSSCSSLGSAIDSNVFEPFAPFHHHRLAADIRINTSTPAPSYTSCFDGFRHNSLFDCFPIAQSQQLVFVHEVGHAHGLDHFDSWPAAMNSAVINHSCNTGSSFRTQPFADDMQGAVHWNGRNWQNKKEVAGMPFFRTSSGGLTKSTNQSDSFYCTAEAKQVLWTSMNYYKDLNGPLYIRYAIVPGVATVATDYNATWVSPVWYVPSSKTFPGATYSWDNDVTVDPSLLTLNNYYRIWLKLDYYNQHSEVDEGNNWIPFDIILGSC